MRRLRAVAETRWPARVRPAGRPARIIQVRSRIGPRSIVSAPTRAMRSRSATPARRGRRRTAGPHGRRRCRRSRRVVGQSAARRCQPIRTRTAAPSGQASCARPVCTSIAASTPDRAEPNAANIASPWQSTTTPPASSTASRSTARCRSARPASRPPAASAVPSIPRCPKTSGSRCRSEARPCPNDTRPTRVAPARASRPRRGCRTAHGCGRPCWLPSPRPGRARAAPRRG